MRELNTDLVLITDIRSGCEKAFLLVYRQFHEKLYFYFLQKTRSEDVSEELVQLTFIKLWQYRQSLNPQLPISQQVFRIAKTTLIDVLRKKAANRLVPIETMATIDLVEEENSANAEHQVELVQASLSHLSPMQQKILSFRLEGLSNKEIAGQMAISKKTVENQVNRAIRSIKKKAKISFVVLLLLNLLNA
ncbi:MULTISPECIES: RNA polymerase sigma factor [Niastella]|uniref:RNA polymerase sigma factor SigS n=1 Tax=Niastella soli TaxID=2821487 RepID=A0ABS3Z549_9BACT|nr:sigma-70 family RNA polymerase sigma factor [Niastella soli]MBO9205168.1 sigma-70 family RNA polymerase sigma factor [Niastella soli]